MANIQITHHKWNELIKPYYEFLVNEQKREFELEDTEDSKIIIRTRQFNKVICTEKTTCGSYPGTLNKKDYRIAKTIYIITGVIINKKTGEENYISHKVFEGEENKANAIKYFENLKEYLR